MAILVSLVVLILVSKELIVFNAETLVLVCFAGFVGRVAVRGRDGVVNHFEQQRLQLKKELEGQRTELLSYYKSYRKLLEESTSRGNNLTAYRTFYYAAVNALEARATASLQERVVQHVQEKCKRRVTLESKTFGARQAERALTTPSGVSLYWDRILQEEAAKSQEELEARLETCVARLDTHQEQVVEEWGGVADALEGVLTAEEIHRLADFWDYGVWFQHNGLQADWDEFGCLPFIEGLDVKFDKEDAFRKHLQAYDPERIGVERQDGEWGFKIKGGPEHELTYGLDGQPCSYEDFVAHLEQEAAAEIVFGSTRLDNVSRGEVCSASFYAWPGTEDGGYERTYDFSSEDDVPEGDVEEEVVYLWDVDSSLKSGLSGASKNRTLLYGDSRVVRADQSDPAYRNYGPGHARWLDLSFPSSKVIAFGDEAYDAASNFKWEAYEALWKSWFEGELSDRSDYFHVCPDLYEDWEKEASADRGAAVSGQSLDLNGAFDVFGDELADIRPSQWASLFEAFDRNGSNEPSYDFYESVDWYYDDLEGILAVDDRLGVDFSEDDEKEWEFQGFGTAAVVDNKYFEDCSWFLDSWSGEFVPAEGDFIPYEFYADDFWTGHDLAGDIFPEFEGKAEDFYGNCDISNNYLLLIDWDDQLDIDWLSKKVKPFIQNASTDKDRAELRSLDVDRIGRICHSLHDRSYELVECVDTFVAQALPEVDS